MGLCPIVGCRVPARFGERFAFALKVERVGGKCRRRRAVIPIGIVEMFDHVVDILGNIGDVTTEEVGSSRHGWRRIRSLDHKSEGSEYVSEERKCGEETQTASSSFSPQPAMHAHTILGARNCVRPAVPDQGRIVKDNNEWQDRMCA